MATKSILTTYGNNRILDAIAQETTVPVTAIVYGDGDYLGSDPSVDQTALLHQIGKLTSITKEFNQKNGFIYFKATIPANAYEGQAFTLTEFGLLDDQNKVLTVTTIPGIEKPAAEDGVSIALPISIGFKTSTGEIMVIVENGTDVYANTNLSNLTQEGEHHFDDTYATVDLDNLSLTGERHFLGRTHITNCLTEIPQRTLCSLDNGVLTLSTGSIVIVPFGINDLSSNYPVGSEFLHENFIVESTQYDSGKFFVWARVQNDITTTFTQGAYNLSVFVDMANNRLTCYARNTDASGASLPSGSTLSFYDTSTNKISRYSAGAQSVTNLSMPIARITSNTNKIVSIDEEFNGLTHIGSTIIIDKDIRMLIPNGRNTNGSLNNIPYVIEILQIRTDLSLSNNVDYTYFYDYTNRAFAVYQTSDYYKKPVDESISTTRVYYDAFVNKYIQYSNSTQTSYLYCELGTFNGKVNTNTYMFNFRSKYAFRAIDYNNFLEIEADIDKLELNIQNVQNIANTAKAKADSSVQLSGNQTVDGNKTFTGSNTFTGTTSFSNTINFTGLTKVPNSATVGSAIATAAISKNASGYIKLGNGIIIQWGRQNSGGHSYNKKYSLPTAFSSTNYKVVANLYNTNDSDRVFFVIKTQATTYFYARAQGVEGGSGGTTACQWIAIGY